MTVDTWTKGLWVTAICFVLLCVFSLPSRAQDFKAAKINLADVYRGSKKLKDAAEELKKMQLDAEAKTVPLKEAVAQLHEKLKSTEKPPTDQEKEKLQAELKEKVQEIENLQQASRVKASFKQKSIQNALLGQIRDVVKKLGEKESLTVIFNAEMLLYSNNIPDLTSQALQELEAMPPLESSKQ